MRTILTALLAMLALGPAAARGAEGIFLTWNECAPDPSASPNRTFACDVNTGQSDLFCAFQVGAPLDSVLGAEVEVDVDFPAAVPDWWRFDAGGCRSGQLLASGDFTGRTACSNPYSAVPAVGVLFTPGKPYDQPDHARIQASASVLPSDGYGSLEPDRTYYAIRLAIRNGSTTGGSACGGCPVPACLVLNSIVLRRQPGAPGGDLALTVPGAGQGNWATWQGGAGADCTAVPARVVTWGRLKALYR